MDNALDFSSRSPVSDGLAAEEEAAVVAAIPADILLSDSADRSASLVDQLGAGLKSPEVLFSVGLLGVTLVFSQVLGLPFSLPSGERAAFVGIHYLFPLVGLAVWGVIAAFGQKRDLARTFFVALPCYALVLVCHFNLKLWGPFINPTTWDNLYWQADTALRPLVDACFWIRQAISPLIPLDSNFYMFGFIGMFYISFCLHALRDARQFRTLFLAALLFQGLGALAYLVAPAIGPFLFETGIEPQQVDAQLGMLGARQDMLAGGTAWLQSHGSTHITVGLAAMPSLHTGGSFLFLLFAWRYARVLVPLYAILFGYIAIDAVASRWHYLVDLPAGIALAFASAWLAERLNPRVTPQTA